MFILCLPLIEASNSDLPPGLLGTSGRIATYCSLSAQHLYLHCTFLYMQKKVQNIPSETRGWPSIDRSALTFWPVKIKYGQWPTVIVHSAHTLGGRA